VFYRRFLNYKTRVVFKIFSNTNILSEILINSEIIREARHNTQNAEVAVGTMVIISTNMEKNNFPVKMCQNVSEEIRKKGQFVTNEV
jgi:hypothetical protein